MEGDPSMRSGAQSSVGTILLLVPILAVPMLAIFGVPQLTPAVSSHLAAQREQRDSLDDAPTFAPRQREEDALEELAGGSTSELPAWADERDATAASLAKRRQQDRAATAAAAEASVASPFQTASAAAAEPAPRRTRPAPAPAAAPVTRSTATDLSGLTWQTAVQRLNELEIRNFRLEPGQQPQQFAFYCSFTPPDSPRVSYRFEAEAEEPLRAVEKVLQQIETWRAAR